MISIPNTIPVNAQYPSTGPMHSSQKSILTKFSIHPVDLVEFTSRYSNLVFQHPHLLDGLLFAGISSTGTLNQMIQISFYDSWEHHSESIQEMTKSKSWGFGMSNLMPMIVSMDKHIIQPCDFSQPFNEFHSDDKDPDSKSVFLLESIDFFPSTLDDYTSLFQGGIRTLETKPFISWQSPFSDPYTIHHLWKFPSLEQMEFFWNIDFVQDSNFSSMRKSVAPFIRYQSNSIYQNLGFSPLG